MKHSTSGPSTQSMANMSYQESSSPQLASASSNHAASLGSEDDSDEEMDWEEIAVPASISATKDAVESGATNPPGPSFNSRVGAQSGNIEITLKGAKKKGKVTDEARK